MDFTIGDFVKLKDWDVFLEVLAVDYDTNSIKIAQRTTDEIYTAWYNISQGFIKQEEDKMEKQDEFRVGDIVWDAAYGKGEVTRVDSDLLPVRVDYTNVDDYNYYTLDGKLSDNHLRSLFFSEPKVEGAVTRPFVPTLVGKRVVIKEPGIETTIAEIVEEYIDKIRYKVPEVSSQIYTSYKNKITTIYEVQSENLLKK